MAPRVSNTPENTDTIEESVMPSFRANGTIEMGFDIEECEPVSEREFRMLMAFVVIAAFAFGCIVHGWLF